MYLSDKWVLFSCGLISPIKCFINVLGNRVNFGVKLFLYLDHIFLILLSNQVYCQADLSESSTSTDSMQINAAFRWKIEVNDNVDCRHVDTSCDQIGAHQGFELSLSESVKNTDSFLSSQVGMQALVLILLFVEFARKHFCSFVGSAKNDTLVDNE